MSGIDTDPRTILLEQQGDLIDAVDSVTFAWRVGSPGTYPWKLPVTTTPAARCFLSNAMGSVTAWGYTTTEGEETVISTYVTLSVGTTTQSWKTELGRHSIYEEYGEDLQITLSIKYPARKLLTIWKHDRWGVGDAGGDWDWGHYFTDEDHTVDCDPHYTDARFEYKYFSEDGDVTAVCVIDGDERTMTAAGGLGFVTLSRPQFNFQRYNIADPEYQTGIPENGVMQGDGLFLLQISNLRMLSKYATLDARDVDYAYTRAEMGWAGEGESYWANSNYGAGVLAFTSNSQLPHVSGYIAPDSDVSLTNLTKKASNTTLTGITISSYTPPGQPPAPGSDWTSMPILDDISFETSQTYTRKLRHYEIYERWVSDESTIEPVDNGVVGIALSYSTGDLIAAGLDPAQWRYRLPLPTPSARWNWGRITHHPRLGFCDWLIDPCTSVSGWSGTATVTLSGTQAITIGTGYAEKDLIPTDPLERGNHAFPTTRWLRLLCTGGPANCVFKIGSKEWEFDGGTTAFIDLCNPTNASGADQVETHVEGTATAWGWGIEPADQLIRITVPSGSLTINQIDMVTNPMVNTAIHTILFQQEELPTTRNEHRGIYLSVDGKVVLDEYVGEVEPASGGARSLPNPYPITTMMNSIASRVGLGSQYGLHSFTDPTPTIEPENTLESDYDFTYARRYFTNERDATQIRPMRQIGYTEAGSNLTAHCWADRVEFGYGTCEPITTEEWFGGAISGIVGDHDDQVPAQNTRVDIRTDGSLVGSTTTRLQGDYVATFDLTMEGPHTAEITSPPSSATIDTMWSGRFARACLEGAVAEASHHSLAADTLTGYMGRAYVVDGHVVTRHSTDGGATWSDAVTHGEGGHPCIYHDLTTGRFGCVYDVDGEMWNLRGSSWLNAGDTATKIEILGPLGEIL